MMTAEEALALANQYTNEHGGGGGGTKDYEALDNKPSINDVELSGNKTSSDLGLMDHYDIDEVPTEESDNLIPSGAVWEADKNINDKLQGSKTATGNPITITDAEPMNAESVVVDLEPKQDLHGYDKPWAGGAGKNKFDDTDSINDVYIDASGVEVAYPNWYASTYIAVNPNTEMTFNPNSTAGGVAKHVFYNGNKEFISAIDSGEQTFTTPSNCEYMRFSYRNDSTDIQLEIGSTATDFEPYSNICPISGYSEVNIERDGDTYTIDLGGTKYGGILDVTNGVLTVDRTIVEYDGSVDETWDGNNDIHGISIPSDCQIEQTPISDAFRGVSPRAYTQVNVGEVALNPSYTNINLRYIEDGLSVWKDYLSNNPLQVCYKLATPLTIHLTPTQIQMLENTNNISTDGTNIQLKYQPKNTVLAEAKEYTNQEIAKLGFPQPPTTDGTYHLECSVSSGIPTIRWVSNS